MILTWFQLFILQEIILFSHTLFSYKRQPELFWPIPLGSHFFEVIVIK